MTQLKHRWTQMALLGIVLLSAGSLNLAWGQFYAPEPIPFPENFNPAQQPMPVENRSVIRQASLNGTTSTTKGSTAPQAAGVQHAKTAKTNAPNIQHAAHPGWFKVGASKVGKVIWHQVWFQNVQKRFQQDDLAARDSLRFKQQVIKSLHKDRQYRKTAQFKDQTERLKAQIAQETEALHLKQEAVKAHRAELKHQPKQ